MSEQLVPAEAVLTTLQVVADYRASVERLQREKQTREAEKSSHGTALFHIAHSLGFDEGGSEP